MTKNNKFFTASTFASSAQNPSINLTKEIPFFNRSFDKKRLKLLFSWYYANKGEIAAFSLIETLTKLGFTYAMKAGISLGVDDLKVPPTKKLALTEAVDSLNITKASVASGNVTALEEFQQFVDTWHRTSENLKTSVVQNFIKKGKSVSSLQSSIEPNTKGKNIKFGGKKEKLFRGVRAVSLDIPKVVAQQPVAAETHIKIKTAKNLKYSFFDKKPMFSLTNKTANSTIQHQFSRWEKQEYPKNDSISNISGKITQVKVTETNQKDSLLYNTSYGNTLNPVYMMAFSGARGNLSQVRQLVGMRGLMADPQGQLVEFPIQSNFREGLTVTEYMISCYGARKGLVDTALRTAAAGYLTRRLVDVSHHQIVRVVTCGTKNGIYRGSLPKAQALRDFRPGRGSLSENVMEAQDKNKKHQTRDLLGLPSGSAASLARANPRRFSLNKNPYSSKPLSTCIGRVLARDIPGIAFRNQEIDVSLGSSPILQKIYETIGIYVRSPLTCRSETGICQLCYGWSVSANRLVSLGEAVGIIAAQSIGEPGTQLTMRTFHTGGVFSGDIMEECRAKHEGIVCFEGPYLGLMVRTAGGAIAFCIKTAGVFSIKSLGSQRHALATSTSSTNLRQGAKIKDNVESTTYKLSPNSLLFVRQGEKVVSGSLLAQIPNLPEIEENAGEATKTIISHLSGEIRQTVTVHSELENIRILAGQKENFYFSKLDFSLSTLFKPSSNPFDNLSNRGQHFKILPAKNLVSIIPGVHRIGNGRYNFKDIQMLLLDDSVKPTNYLSYKNNFLRIRSLSEQQYFKPGSTGGVRMQNIFAEKETQLENLAFLVKLRFFDALKLHRNTFYVSTLVNCDKKIHETTSSTDLKQNNLSIIRYSRTRLSSFVVNLTKMLPNPKIYSAIYVPKYNQKLQNFGFMPTLQGRYLQPHKDLDIGLSGLDKKKVGNKNYGPKNFYLAQQLFSTSWFTPTGMRLVSPLTLKSLPTRATLSPPTKQELSSKTPGLNTLAVSKKLMSKSTILKNEQNRMVKSSNHKKGLPSGKISDVEAASKIKSLLIKKMAKINSKAFKISPYLAQRLGSQASLENNTISESRDSNNFYYQKIKDKFFNQPHLFFKSTEKDFNIYFYKYKKNFLKKRNAPFYFSPYAPFPPIALIKKANGRKEGRTYDIGSQQRVVFQKNIALIATGLFTCTFWWSLKKSFYKNSNEKQVIDKTFADTSIIAHNYLFWKLRAVKLQKYGYLFWKLSTILYIKAYSINFPSPFSPKESYRQSASDLGTSRGCSLTLHCTAPATLKNALGGSFLMGRPKHQMQHERNHKINLKGVDFLSNDKPQIKSNSFGTYKLVVYINPRCYAFKSHRLYPSDIGASLVSSTLKNAPLALRSKRSKKGPDLYSLREDASAHSSRAWQGIRGVPHAHQGQQAPQINNFSLICNISTQKFGEIFPIQGNTSYRDFKKNYRVYSLPSKKVRNFKKRNMPLMQHPFRDSGGPGTLADKAKISNQRIGLSHKNMAYIQLTHDDRISYKIVLQNSPFSVGETWTPEFFGPQVGTFVNTGDEIFKNYASAICGQIIEKSSSKLTLRLTENILYSNLRFRPARVTQEVKNKSWLRKGTSLVTLPYISNVTGDIVAGIPKIEQLFEARGEALEETVEKLWSVYKDAFVPKAKAVRECFKEIGLFVATAIQNVYSSQGVHIADKHLEVIIRQMTRRALITDPGDTEFLPDEFVDLHTIECVNWTTYGVGASYRPHLIGITKASLTSNSFLSSASFQQTARVLERETFLEKTDRLLGLKERVMMGALIDAGTGGLDTDVFLSTTSKKSNFLKKFDFFSRRKIEQELILQQLQSNDVRKE